jgi:hypothetical protein
MILVDYGLHPFGNVVVIEDRHAAAARPDDDQARSTQADRANQ